MRRVSAGVDAAPDGCIRTRGPRWFAVMTRPHREAFALSQLQRQGFQTWLPQRHKTVRHARQSRLELRPLFPRYLFVRLDPTVQRWRAINGTYGVTGLVSFGDTPTPVPHGVVEGLLVLSDEAGVVRFEARLQAGDKVRLAAGPFAEEVGVLARLDGADAARVLIEIMGREVAVSARRHQLLPVA